MKLRILTLALATLLVILFASKAVEAQTGLEIEEVELGRTRISPSENLIRTYPGKWWPYAWVRNHDVR